jgi:hypothetical protein
VRISRGVCMPIPCVCRGNIKQDGDGRNKSGQDIKLCRINISNGV